MREPLPPYIHLTHQPAPTQSDVYVMEPLTAGTLECLALGVPTSYKRVIALTCEQLFQGEQRAESNQSGRLNRVGSG